MRHTLIIVTFLLVACGQAPKGTPGPTQTSAPAGQITALPSPFRALLNPGLGWFSLPSGLESGPWTVGVKYQASAAIASYTRAYEWGGFNQVGGGSIELNSGDTQNRIACVIFNGMTSIDQAVTARVVSSMETPSSATVLCVYSGTTLTMYVNGVAQGSATGAYHAPSWNEGIGIGSAGEFPLTGSISNVSWWQRALTASEAVLY